MQHVEKLGFYIVKSLASYKPFYSNRPVNKFLYLTSIKKVYVQYCCFHICSFITCFLSDSKKKRKRKKKRNHSGRCIFHIPDFNEFMHCPESAFYLLYFSHESRHCFRHAWSGKCPIQFLLLLVSALALIRRYTSVI